MTSGISIKEKIVKHTARTCLVLFVLLLAAHAFEAIVLRMDETVFAENFLNKLFGIAVLIVALRVLGWRFRDIGLSKAGAVKGALIGAALATASFTVAFCIEIMLLKGLGRRVGIGFYAAGFSLTGDPIVQTGAGYLLLCVLFNLLNVFMEEGIFRGLFDGILCMDHSSKAAMLIGSFLFGVWHLVTPLHHLIDGDLDLFAFLGLGLGYMALSGVMGIKWSLLYRMTGNLSCGMADHFFNNCIATNLLHVVTETGVDEWMTVRVLIAQILSFAIVVAVWIKRRRTDCPNA